MGWPLATIRARFSETTCCHLQGLIFPTYPRNYRPSKIRTYECLDVVPFVHLSSVAYSQNLCLRVHRCVTFKLENCFMLFVMKWICFEQCTYRPSYLWVSFLCTHHSTLKYVQWTVPCSYIKWSFSLHCVVLFHTYSVHILLTYSHTPLLTYLLTHVLTRLFTYSLTNSLTNWLTQLFTHSLTHLLTHSLTYLLTHSLTHSLI